MDSFQHAARLVPEDADTLYFIGLSQSQLAIRRSDCGIGARLRSAAFMRRRIDWPFIAKLGQEKKRGNTLRVFST